MVVWVQPGAVGARPRAVEAWTRTGGTARGCGQDRWGVARGRSGPAKTVGVWSRVVGTQPEPWGVAKTMGAKPGAVWVRPRPWGCGQDRGGEGRGCGGVAKPWGRGQEPWGRGQGRGGGGQGS